MTKGRAGTYLKQRALFGVKLGLDSIRALVAALGHPERHAPCVLVAGTNGKGSVVAYLDVALRAAGLRVGRFTSPHLRCVNERICIDGAPISDDDLDDTIDALRDAAARLVAAQKLPDHPTYFEALTAAALVYFRSRDTDVTLLEVGLGGRLDATNVVEPVVSAIVTVDRDHEAHLGASLREIARQKAGVMRRGHPVIVGNVGVEARLAIREVASESGARLIWAGEGTTVTPRGRVLELRTPRNSFALAPLPGRHQRENVVVAARILDALEAELPDLDLGRLGTQGRPDWPGRLQWLPTEPPILVDGAHNAAAAVALGEFVADIGPFVLLFGAMKDKDIAELARPVFPLASEIVLTRTRSERAAAPEEIAERTRGLGPAPRLAPSVALALAQARSLAGRDRRLVVAGSLYLVGAVLDELSGELDGD